MRHTFAALKGLATFQTLPGDARRLVFYAEDASAHPHLLPVLDALPADLPVAYLTSSPTDPLLTAARPGLRALFVGTGAIRTRLFATLRAGVLVTTSPDLGSPVFPRSLGVHYVYLHHAIVSTHMVYRPAAFDAFDTIFCVGPHHVRETAHADALRGGPARRTVHHGYGRLDTLAALAAARARAPAGRPLRVLVAPSWGQHALLETWGTELLDALLDAGHSVTLRPHPMTARHRPELLAALARRFGPRPEFAHDNDVSATESLLAADVMVSDWSGAAFEFAFARERGVVFVDVPRKINNAAYEQLGLEPIEVTLREQVGRVVTPGDVSGLLEAVERLARPDADLTAAIRQARAGAIFNLGTSGAAGARALCELVS